MSRHLTPKEESRIRQAIKQRLMHVSPTISPAPKNMERNEIESIFQALHYYAEHGVTEVILQPKFMGSYCDIYLHKDITKSRFFSRKGYDITRLITAEALIEAAQPVWDKLNSQELWIGVDQMIIQAELLPWAALGKGLIERDFESYGLCHKENLDHVKSSNLYSLIEKERATPEYQNYMADKAILSIKELQKKYPNHVISQFEATSRINIPDLSTYEESLEIYNQQVKIYGSDGKLEFKPFHILKAICDDESEIILDSHVEGFAAVSDEPYLVLDLLPQKIEESISLGYDFFNKLVGQNMEGIVIKPEEVWVKDIAPMFKVRNLNYLQMIYGVNFRDKYDYYLEKRRVAKKLKCSINEWNIAQALLHIPLAHINSSNEEYQALIRMRILEEDFEAQLDTRL